MIQILYYSTMNIINELFYTKLHRFNMKGGGIMI